MGVALLIIVVVTAIGRALTKGQSIRRKRIVWGILIMIGLNPFVSWLIGICFAIFAGKGFAGMGMMVILFIGMFFIGAIILISGLLTKADIKQASPK
ncbi:hypothetical protein MKZ25_07970 [Solibacillus sp. FSL W7-1464]|uniref:hypothetical protein n=1 Tax=Solibacillus sp. FSL W7-1464 TaxID=2921706 RepID=UPI0030F91832